MAITWALYILISIHIFRIKISLEIANVLYRHVSVVKLMKLSLEIPWAKSNMDLAVLTAGSILHSTASPTLTQVQLLVSKFSRCFNSMHYVRKQDINKLLFNDQGPLLLLILYADLPSPDSPLPKINVYCYISKSHPYRIFITIAFYLFNVSLFVLGSLKEIACSSTSLS